MSAGWLGLALWRPEWGWAGLGASAPPCRSVCPVEAPPQESLILAYPTGRDKRVLYVVLEESQEGNMKTRKTRLHCNFHLTLLSKANHTDQISSQDVKKYHTAKIRIPQQGFSTFAPLTFWTR